MCGFPKRELARVLNHIAAKGTQMAKDEILEATYQIILMLFLVISIS